jgi:spore coat protein CotF
MTWKNILKADLEDIADNIDDIVEMINDKIMVKTYRAGGLEEVDKLLASAVMELEAASNLLLELQD